MRLNFLLILFFAVLLSAKAQVAPYKVFELKSDSTDYVFKVIRIKDVKLKYVTRGARTHRPQGCFKPHKTSTKVV